MSTGTHLERAKQELAKAETVRNRWTLFSDGSKYRKAAQHYENASNLFRVAKDYTSAGKASLLAADMHNKCNDEYQTIQSYVKAANIFRQESPEEAIVCLRKVIDLYNESGKFSMVCRCYREIAEILENQSEFRKCIEAYEMAAESYNDDNNSREAGKCLLKVAHFSVQLENYERATEIYEQIAKAYVNNSLLRWRARELLLKGGLCYLANNDFIGAQRALERYIEIDPTFAAQREYRFLRELIKASGESSVDNFSRVCAEYDSITPFDEWMTMILLRAKPCSFTSETGSSSINLPSGYSNLPSGYSNLPDDLS